MLTTATAIQKARFNLALARATPIPDVQVGLTMSDDLTAPGPYRMVTGVTVGLPVPIFDQNRGAIRQSQASLLRAMEEPHRVEAALTASFADAYRRYEESRVILQMYQKTILPKQVQSFRGAIKLHFGGPQQLQFTDVISAEQNLITAIGAYLPILQAQWQAVADVSSLLQTDQVYQMVEEVSSAPAVNFEELLRLKVECHHPCAAAAGRSSFNPPPAAGPLTQSALGAAAETTAATAPAAAPTIIPAAANVPAVSAPPQLNSPPPTRDAIRADFGPVSRN